MTEEARVKCALLSADDLFVKLVEIDRAQVSDRHVLTITECDLPPWKYRWVRDERNPFGGCFVPLHLEHIIKGHNS